MLYQFELSTNTFDMVNITSSLNQALKDSNIKNGTAIIYCPHTTAAITINENADPDVVRDLIFAEKYFFPTLKEYRHFEGNSQAHLLSSLIGVSETVIINNGNPILGTWQSIYFCEFDGPRHRKFYIQINEIN